ncbi:MAG: hypothetical protein IAX21_00670 [Candidatus Bathyarchaeota archaeon]|nr:MAG: hypothetical protein NUK63_05175 [Candidatus Bathyarchaeum tardum]WNZ29417.1 MAG: hypothetical protein IAX21_00670 [Candidatus Bathyarchaeota archaeon]
MENRRILSIIFGAAQGGIGIIAGAATVMLFFNFLEIQTLFNLPTEFLPIYLLILGLFSLFSIINGFFLIREWWR